VLCLCGCGDAQYPRDPDDTLARVLADGRMRVIAVDHVPWVAVEDDGVPRGAEVDLVEAFARELGVAVDWRRAPAFPALEALERGDADLAVGGFTKKAVSAQGGAGQTYAYFIETLVVAAAPGAPIPRALDGEAVYVARSLLVDGLVEDEGGVPVPEKTGTVLFAALPDWQVPARGLVPTEVVLSRHEHVMAVPQGENAWIIRLERFLRANADGFAARLREHAP
jgi:ABC-type amino acid transport substrate-binding protein